MAKSYDVTTAGVNPVEDRAHRMRMYFLAMALRVVCVVSLFWVHGWWVLLVGAGAIFLPWFAVMVGNAVAHGGEQTPDAPEPLQLGSAEPEERTQADAASEVIVIDVEPARRGAGGASGASGSASGGDGGTGGDGAAAAGSADPAGPRPEPGAAS
ncbi:DUF3099 domain-containing protein [Leucobacter sp. USHLN153]|uniref:DUF3099 domain-containing protein n=1 Tax=Leucobacter sp. USHLN153 TaxID=3081268 RepID=UPI003016C468